VVFVEALGKRLVRVSLNAERLADSEDLTTAVARDQLGGEE